MSDPRQMIAEALLPHRRKLKGWGVRRLSLFGSLARGQGSETSDLDFVVQLERNTFDAYMDLKLFLEDLFDRSVDLVIEDAIKPRLRDRIRSEMIDLIKAV